MANAHLSTPFIYAHETSCETNQAFIYLHNATKFIFSNANVTLNDY